MNEVKVGTSITVRVLKYDGSEYRRWNATVASDNGSLLVLNAEFDVEVQHDDLGHIPRGTRTVEYYWLDRWYNVFRFLTANGETHLWYCNVNVPPTFKEATLSYVDLDIDVLVEPDLSYRVLDLDEFEHHARIFKYPEAIKASAQKALADLVTRISGRHFPFDLG